jgi:hypothetical protein
VTDVDRVLTTMIEPWAPDVVDALNAAQVAGRVHPFTCGVSSGHGPGYLTATTEGWVCTEPGCDYRQTWALAAMTEPWARAPLSP